MSQLGGMASARRRIRHPRSSTSSINAGLADLKLKARFADLGAAVFPSSPVEFAKFIAEQTEKWARVIRAANIKPTVASIP